MLDKSFKQCCQFLNTYCAIVPCVNEFKYLLDFFRRNLERNSFVQQRLKFFHIQLMVLVDIGQLYHCLRRHVAPLYELHKLFQVATCTLTTYTLFPNLKLLDKQAHKLLPGNQAILIDVEDLKEVQNLRFCIAWGNADNELHKLRKIQEATLVYVDSAEKLSWVLFSSTDNGDDLINFSRKNVSTLSEVNQQHLLFDNCPIDPSFFLSIQVFEQDCNFMSGNCWSNLPQESSKCPLTKAITFIRLNNFVQVEVPSLDIFLDFQQDSFDIVINVDLRSLLSRVTALHQRMFENFLPAHSLLFINDQTSLDEVFCMLSYLTVIWELQWLAVNVVEILIQAARRPRSVSKYEFVKNQPQTPDIRLCCICLLSQQLRRHIDRGSTYIIQLFLPQNIGFAGEPEVCNFIQSLFQKHVCGLYISMNVSFTDQNFKSQQDISESLYRFRLSEFMT